MDLYPAIDLRAGRCVRLVQGDFDRETVYGDDPVATAKAFEAAGAQWVHVVDLDAARRQGSNRDIVEAVTAAVGIPVQTGGGVRDASLLATGVARVVAGSVALDDPEVVERMAAEHPGRVAVGLDHWGGEVKVRGWEEGSGRRLADLVERFAGAGVAAFVVTDISRDGMLVGPDVEGLAALAASTAVPVIASGGVGALDDLRALAGTGVAGAIVGKALYEGRFTVEDAVAACR
ncbi:MAG: phosphoribosylformimino-5-aminoimidazole carboxamide ribotide isomerase [Acidimicrobiaceae bacterium]|nr:phosphoribosylformimino-5-aminoimidazole carboxamide ribotide isomerase [Acidimicrobiaceae bacterium]